MARPEAWRQDRRSYPFSTSVAPRFNDMDILGHINNVAMAAIFEEGRSHFSRSLQLPRQKGDRWLIANVQIAYLREAHYPEPIEVAAGCGPTGVTSRTLLLAAFQNGRCVATCDTILVRSAGKGPSSIPDELRAVFSDNMAGEPPTPQSPR